MHTTSAKVVVSVAIKLSPAIESRYICCGVPRYKPRKIVS